MLRALCFILHHSARLPLALTMGFIAKAACASRQLRGSVVK